MAYSTCHQEEYYREAVRVAHEQATLLKERKGARRPVNPLIHNTRPFKVKRRSTPAFPFDMPLREEETVTKRLTNLERTLDLSRDDEELHGEQSKTPKVKMP